MCADIWGQESGVFLNLGFFSLGMMWANKLRVKLSVGRFSPITHQDRLRSAYFLFQLVLDRIASNKCYSF
jgi:hypothetical protein